MTSTLEILTNITERLSLGLSIFIINQQLVDPAVNYKVRPRVNAFLLEVVEEFNSLSLKTNNIKLIELLLELQDKDGSWNEVHRNYNFPSALVTSICGLSLINASKKVNLNLKHLIKDSIKRARDYVKKQLTNDFVKKSKFVYANILNSGSTIALFLQASSDNLIADESVLKIANFICKNQKQSGVFPYGIKKAEFPFFYHLNVSSVFYQALTIYYLDRIELTEKKVENSIMLGKRWLRSCLSKSGGIMWDKSEFPFSMYQSNTIPYLLYVLSDDIDSSIQIRTLRTLQSMILENNLLPTREPGSFLLFPYNFSKSFRFLFSDKFPLRHKLFRIGYCAFNEFARCRYKKENKISFFDLFLPQSTTKPRPFNFPDVAFTAESLKVLIEYKKKII